MSDSGLAAHLGCGRRTKNDVRRAAASGLREVGPGAFLHFCLQNGESPDTIKPLFKRCIL
jgi:hypothetical protein